MTAFVLHFFLCNIFICGILVVLFVGKRIFKNYLTSRMQYNLWLIFLGLLTVPFFPIPIFRFSSIFSLFSGLWHNTAPNMEQMAEEAIVPHPYTAANWMNDFTLSVENRNLSSLGLILSGIWMAGIFVMLFCIIRAYLRLRHLKKSALPVQNQKVRRLYQGCLDELHITKDIPLYSTAFLKSPMIAGFFKPEIYLPIHLISDYSVREIRYMLLHELKHYQYKDSLINAFMNLALLCYWFNPFVWYALREMRNDREVACDTSVLKMLNETDYADYGHTLLNFVQKVSANPFPFAAGMSGSMKQMRLRITNIASYEHPSAQKRRKGLLSFLLIASLLLALAPVLSTYAVDDSHYEWDGGLKNSITYVDYSAYFEEYDGSFVLYDLENDAWKIFHPEQATQRISPDSTYKLCIALSALEEGIITPDHSFMAWDEEPYVFDAWNQDQTLSSAMESSVNWYFQALDSQLERTSVKYFLSKMEYGNQDLSGNPSTYWMESSLKISPVEQVEFLKKFYQNSFGFSPENVKAVKESILLSSTEKGKLYGKTGTGQVNGKNNNGWFIGYVECSDHTFFFATNLQADDHASGSQAAKISMDILADLGVW